ncbi:MAG: histidine triad nucleotide-binding protein [Gammaproteobacteria bacterium]|nr:MAG: histidine triad nucleotide-binding protein [Gammaproteobacteria bacterium]RKZ37891.1 MAG: histidine triad nucleotide-binding protein [Gammaproteobacteria bacterium]RKZ72632.1 MAG: histidine triad nucleotide-binding protein [Gammaproteobacteria bacterium]
MITDPDCLFCKIIAGKTPSEQVHSDEQVVVFKDINPKAPIHLLIVPRDHIISLNELSVRHDGLMGHMIRLLPKLAKEQGLNNGFRTIINTGPAGGQIVFHLHIHLLGGSGLGGTGF